MLAHWLRSWQHTTRTATNRRTHKCGRSRFPGLRVEALDDRIVPSTVRTITYNQITTLADNSLNINTLGNRISANGNKAVFTTGFPGTVYTINTDGSGLTVVDPAGDPDVDISANDGLVLETIG